MTDEFDWLDEDDDSWLDDEAAPAAEVVSEPVVHAGKPAVPKVPRPKRKKRPKELILAERALRPAQRVYMGFLIQCSTIAEADRAFANAGYGFNRSTLYRWRQDPVFAETMRLKQQHMFEMLGISKEKVLLDAEKAKEIALTPKPILHKGIDTGHREVEIGAYLRALELQGKGVGIGVQEQQRVAVHIDIDFSGPQPQDVGVTLEGEAQ